MKNSRETTMKRATRSGRPESILCAFAMAAILCATSAHAQSVIAPTVRSHFSVTPIPFEQARLTTENAIRPNAVRAMDQQGTTAPPEIVELARALKNDPD